MFALGNNTDIRFLAEYGRNQPKFNVSSSFLRRTHVNYDGFISHELAAENYDTV